LQYSCRSLHRNPFRSEFGRKVGLQRRPLPFLVL
jgi:hypothetical protein